MAVESGGSGTAGTQSRAASAGWWLARVTLELLAVTALFAAAGAWPTPDSNEAHYLPRARHAWDPTWAAGDFFLESKEAHGVFYRLLGPLAGKLPLEDAAWIGRWCGWGALAAGYGWAASAVLPSMAGRVVAAALFSVAVRHTPAAGEWVIGGCEAKVFAWALVLAGVGWFARGRIGPAWMSLGAATAIHPLVGGWAMIVLVPVAVREIWLHGSGKRERSGALILELAGGLALAALGVLPALALSGDADAALRAKATATYVTERLPHHLLLRTFADGFAARQILAILLWWMLLPLGGRSPARRRMAAFTAGAIGVSLAGCLVSLLERPAPEFAHGLLRFYWFRLADGIVPLGLSVAAVAAMDDGLAKGGRRWIAWAVVAGLVGVDLVVESQHWPLPGRTGLVARADSKVQAAAWRDICGWVRDNTPADACFLPPRAATSFHWYTARREVVCWKNVPQDPKSIIQWRQRIIDCYSSDGTLKGLAPSTADLGMERVREVASRYGADHIIVAVNPLLPSPFPDPPLHANSGYAVHRLPDPRAPSPAALAP
ncbi:MAG: hypothetical protein DWH79_12690 [Planctomycetota bacterium]|nr:MAG: hypothetical protein DWH79_12690 [Planctomycetota bacterium]